MKITKIEVFQLDLPLTKPYYLSGGRLKFEKIDSTFVRIETDEGIHGWGEGCPWGHTYLPAHGPGIRAGIETLAPFLIGENPCALRHINRVMDTQLPGHEYVKSAIDMACWDILGKQAGLPVYMLMGAPEPTPVPVLSSISTGTSESMLELIGEAAEKGYKDHSAKVGGTDIEADIERINGIEAGLQPGHKVTFDVNRAWEPCTAIAVLNAVKTRSWIEQPCETLDQVGVVARRVPQPILLDECMTTYQDHLEAWKNECGNGVKIKPNRVGGLTKALQIRDFAVSIGWHMNIEDLGGSCLADTAAIHLASSCPNDLNMSSWLSHYHLSVDPIPANQGARNVNGFATPPSLPGLGVEPMLDVLGNPVAVYV